MQAGTAEIAVVVLAGGEAKRFPGKLESSLGGTPLLLQVCRKAQSIGTTYVSAGKTLSDSLRRQLQCPVIDDREEKLGPLGGLVSTLERIAEPYVFVMAGDAPFADRTFAALRDAMQNSDKAVVAENPAGRIEPLCALYNREAFLTAAHSLAKNAAVADVARHLNARRVRFQDDRAFLNINTPADRAKIGSV